MQKPSWKFPKTVFYGKGTEPSKNHRQPGNIHTLTFQFEL